MCTLKSAYLSCEFAFRVRFQGAVRALSFNCVWNANQREYLLNDLYRISTIKYAFFPLANQIVVLKRSDV